VVLNVFSFFNFVVLKVWWFFLLNLHFKKTKNSKNFRIFFCRHSAKIRPQKYLFIYLNYKNKKLDSKYKNIKIKRWVARIPELV